MKNFFIFLFFISFSFAQVFSSYDYVGARATSMSGSVTSGPEGTWSIFHNPAQLSNLKGVYVSNGYSQIFGLEFLPYYNLGLSYNGWALNIEQFSTELGEVELSSESVIGLSKGVFLHRDRQSSIQLGLRLNFYEYELGISSGIDGDGSSGVSLGNGTSTGIDFGFQGSLHDKYYIAYYFQNINSSLITKNLGNDLPRTMSVGLSYRPYDNLLTSLEMKQLLGYENQQISFGIEYYLLQNFVIRTGVQSNSNRFSGGFEYHFSRLKFAYGFITHHIMPVTHQLSIELKIK